MDNNNKAWAIILAAGSGSRIGDAAPLPKQFLNYRQRPLYWQSALIFSRCAFIEGVIFVFPEKYFQEQVEILKTLYSKDSPGILYDVAIGGNTRQESCISGLSKVPLICRKVLIHDAARPFITPELVWRVYKALTPEFAAAIPAIPVTDTIKMVSSANSLVVQFTLQRDTLVAVQTPQIFYSEILREAHEEAIKKDITATDDSALLENLGYNIKIARGDAANVKITTVEDLKLIAKGEKMRLPANGFGYDAHRFGPGRPLKIGGVLIPCEFEIIAHSDGDVLLHALIDALLGCASLGDIGKHFPDTSPEFDNISSAILLDKTLSMVKENNIEICHVDLTLVAQKPRIDPWRVEIQKNVANLLQIPKDWVNFKATTEEKMGFTGALEGIKAYALVSALKASAKSLRD